MPCLTKPLKEDPKLSVPSGRISFIPLTNFTTMVSIQFHNISSNFAQYTFFNMLQHPLCLRYLHLNGNGQF